MRLTPDPLVERLGRTTRARLAAVGRTRGPGGNADSALYAAARDGLRDMGAYTFEAPVTSGGLDLGLVAGSVIARELGRHALHEVYGGPALVTDVLRDQDAYGDLAEALARGDVPVALGGLDALCGLDGPPAGAPQATRRCTDAWELTGQITLGRMPDDAARCCVAVTTDAGVLLVLLGPDIWRKRCAAQSPGRPAVLGLDGLVVADGDVVGRLSGTALPGDDLLARARVRQAAHLLGLAQGACDLAAGHARSRQQFGRPLMEFQAVGFTLARGAVDLRAVRVAVERAAWLADTGGSGGALAQAAAEALAQAAETALRVIRDAMQIHGARGMTRAAAVHRYYELARLEVPRLGPAALLWREAGAHRLNTTARAA
ncbi:acyl-CoA dehydrogenase family protein [Streptomyces caelestis]|uniref:Alkylation response protein AidB-like acyl-CoA dehydrogenase n=1 Tax=Streptomyces caelestis TaxID=36816 RepID=A0A7W9HA75_9ACTN|nr:acyl-CoA dehydrogenase family protein [Streptomyces caelestis]MBB5798529.1 alkylation response protein AidB-like acyl-CoA dehydrogenase [Streptomyces caelestis]GGW51009.1 hypothetical protein GCM10010320_34580 [Streptomyces caelestis]